MTRQLEEVIHAAGVAAPIAFVVLYMILTIALVPGSVPSIAAGALFGAAWGTVLTVLGATLGATGGFLIARRFGRAPLRARTGSRFHRLDAFIARRGFLGVLYVRLVPIFPFNAVNYAFGLTGVSTREYVAGTALGIVPGTVAFVALGSSLHDPGSPAFLTGLAMVIAFAAAGPLASRALGRRRSTASESTP